MFAVTELDDEKGVSVSAEGADAALAARAQGSGFLARLVRLYSLTKPRVMYANALTTAAGFFLASAGNFDWALFIAVCGGTTLIIGSACVLNNVLDRDIDQKMARTSKRATVTGDIGVPSAVAFSTLLAAAGFAILVVWVNWLVVAIGVAGFIFYVVLYGMLSKRMSMHGTLVGSISGAAPILAGYAAVTGSIDVGAVLAFLIMFFWQEPAFYSIAIYRRHEYARADVPVMSVARGVAFTKRQILLHTVLFVITSLLLQVFGYVGWTYSVVMAAVGAWWIGLAISGLRGTNDDQWARTMFRFSLAVLLILCVMFVVGPILP